MMVRLLNRIPKLLENMYNRTFNVPVCHKTVRKECFSQCRGYVVYPFADSFNFNLINNNQLKNNRLFSNIDQSTNSLERELNSLEFDRISTETLESLSEYFDELVEDAVHLKDADVSYRDGVLTIKFGDKYGTYVINRQTPNKQIWLSSPTSGPKRYDFIKGRWIYKHDGKSLHELLNNEISKIVKSDTSFNKCLYSGAS